MIVPNDIVDHKSYMYTRVELLVVPYSFLDVWLDSKRTCCIKFLSVVWFDFGTNSRSYIGQNIQQNKGQDRTQVKAKDRWD